MVEGKPFPGRLAESRSGRDSGRFYLVMETVGDNYVLVADGLVRRLEKPKKKNVKHLTFHSRVGYEIAEKLNNGERVTNLELRRAIQRLMEQPEE